MTRSWGAHRWRSLKQTPTTCSSFVIKCRERVIWICPLVNTLACIPSWTLACILSWKPRPKGSVNTKFEVFLRHSFYWIFLSDEPLCEDRRQDCHHLKEPYCRSHERRMKEMCSKTCGFCRQDGERKTDETTTSITTTREKNTRLYNREIHTT